MSKKAGRLASQTGSAIMLNMTEDIEDLMVDAALDEWFVRVKDGVSCTPEEHVRALIQAALAAVVLDSVPDSSEDPE